MNYNLFFAKTGNLCSKQFSDLFHLLEFLEKYQIQYYFIENIEKDEKLNFDIYESTNQYLSCEVDRLREENEKLKKEKPIEKYEGIRPSDNLCLVDIDEYNNLVDENKKLNEDKNKLLEQGLRLTQINQRGQQENFSLKEKNKKLKNKLMSCGFTEEAIDEMTRN